MLFLNGLGPRRCSLNFAPVSVDAGLQTRFEFTHMLVEAAARMAALMAWRTLLAEGLHQRANELNADAHRCARLAQSAIGLRLAEELDAIARNFEQDANILVSRMQKAAYQLRLPWAGLP